MIYGLVDDGLSGTEDLINIYELKKQLWTIFYIFMIAQPLMLFLLLALFRHGGWGSLEAHLWMALGYPKKHSWGFIGVKLAKLLSSYWQWRIYWACEQFVGTPSWVKRWKPSPNRRRLNTLWTFLFGPMVGNLNRCRSSNGIPDEAYINSFKGQ